MPQPQQPVDTHAPICRAYTRRGCFSGIFFVESSRTQPEPTDRHFKSPLRAHFKTPENRRFARFPPGTAGFGAGLWLPVGRGEIPGLAWLSAGGGSPFFLRANARKKTKNSHPQNTKKKPKKQKKMPIFFLRERKTPFSPALTRETNNHLPGSAQMSQKRGNFSSAGRPSQWGIMMNYSCEPPPC